MSTKLQNQSVVDEQPVSENKSMILQNTSIAQQIANEGE